MRHVDTQIRNRIDAFVRELTALIRRATLEAVSKRLGVEPRSGVGGKGVSMGKAAARPAARGQTPRRSSEQLEVLARRVLGYVKANPGRNAERIAKALGANSQDLSLPLRKLTAAGRLSTTGQSRATKYFVSAGRSKPAGVGSSRKLVRRVKRRPASKRNETRHKDG
jgi:hypothetical protein